MFLFKVVLNSDPDRKLEPLCITFCADQKALYSQGPNTKHLKNFNAVPISNGSILESFWTKWQLFVWFLNGFEQNDGNLAQKR